MHGTHIFMRKHLLVLDFSKYWEEKSPSTYFFKAAFWMHASRVDRREDKYFSFWCRYEYTLKASTHKYRIWGFHKYSVLWLRSRTCRAERRRYFRLKRGEPSPLFSAAFDKHCTVSAGCQTMRNSDIRYPRATTDPRPSEGHTATENIKCQVQGTCKGRDVAYMAVLY